MNDLVSYNDKHNEANGENNKDGIDNNISNNCGAEGKTADPKIESLRKRRIKNFLLTLFVSHGVPMLLGGDEFRRTQDGNNNAYCQDNETSWHDWSLLEQNRDIYRFAEGMIAFRRSAKSSSTRTPRYNGSARGEGRPNGGTRKKNSLAVLFTGMKNICSA
jgi:glycogen operon protein